MLFAPNLLQDFLGLLHVLMTRFQEPVGVSKVKDSVCQAFSHPAK